MVEGLAKRAECTDSFATHSVEQGEQIAPYYDRTKLTTKHLKDVARHYLRRLEQKVALQPLSVLEAWGTVLEPPFSTMTQAIKYDAGVVYVAVSNSSLLSLLHRPDEKRKLLEALREKVPTTPIRDIIFSIK
jgi:hypothetical protein